MTGKWATSFPKPGKRPWERGWQVGNASARATGYILCTEKTGSELIVYQFRPWSFLITADDRTGSLRGVCFEVLCQSINDFCGYRLIIDGPKSIDTN